MLSKANKENNKKKFESSKKDNTIDANRKVYWGKVDVLKWQADECEIRFA